MTKDPTTAAIEKYKRHPSILKIRKHIRAANYFNFKPIDDKKMAGVLKHLNAKKAKQEDDIPIKSIKGAATDMRYFARGKFSRSLIHKKNFSLI